MVIYLQKDYPGADKECNRLVTVGPQEQVFAQDKVEALNVISQSDLIGSQVLETPYGVMTIENAYLLPSTEEAYCAKDFVSSLPYRSPFNSRDDHGTSQDEIRRRNRSQAG